MHSSAVRTGVWLDVYAMIDVDLIRKGPIRRRSHLHVKAIVSGVRSLGNGPVLDSASGLDLWQYRVYAEIP